MKSKKVLTFNVLFRPEPEGGYTAIVPSLPGCVSYGKTLEKSQEMIRDAIAGYVTVLQKKKQSVPHDDGVFMSTIDLVPRTYA